MNLKFLSNILDWQFQFKIYWVYGNSLVIFIYFFVFIVLFYQVFIVMLVCFSVMINDVFQLIGGVIMNEIVVMVLMNKDVSFVCVLVLNLGN